MSHHDIYIISVLTFQIYDILPWETVANRCQQMMFHTVMLSSCMHTRRVGYLGLGILINVSNIQLYIVENRLPVLKLSANQLTMTQLKQQRSDRVYA